MTVVHMTHFAGYLLHRRAFLWFEGLKQGNMQGGASQQGSEELAQGGSAYGRTSPSLHCSVSRKPAWVHALVDW